MYLFSDIKIKVLLSRLFCVQARYLATVLKGVKSIRETFLGMACVVNGIVKFALRRLRWTAVVFIDTNLSV